MTNIAVLGFGVVGGGIACVLDENRERIEALAGGPVNLKYILDLRDFPDSPYGDRVVHDIDRIIKDESVGIVCEAMGGVHPALEFSLAALNAGKSVVTSNKELVAKHGVELLEAAEKNNAAYLYEAAVGGGIPVLRSMKTSLASDRIKAVTGILNGTTNYILTKMEKDGADFASALREAQDLGYAEANPSADVDGFDAQRKIMILTAIATGKMLSEDSVYTETMTRLTPDDINAARRMGGAVKLLGCFREKDGKIASYVCPFIVGQSAPLANINDVYNGVWVEGETTGDIMFYGRGAGRYPTAGAMISDVCAIMTGAFAAEYPRRWTKADRDDTAAFEDLSFRYYVRTESADREALSDASEALFGECTFSDESPEGTAEIVTGEIRERDMRNMLSSGKLGKVLSVIRIL